MTKGHLNFGYLADPFQFWPVHRTMAENRDSWIPFVDLLRDLRYDPMHEGSNLFPNVLKNIYANSVEEIQKEIENILTLVDGVHKISEFDGSKPFNTNTSPHHFREGAIQFSRFLCYPR